MANISRVEIAAAADDLIGGEVLAWAGATEYWTEHDLEDEYTVVGDVLDWCERAWIDSEVWDGGMPGLSDVWYTVSTTDPERLRAEIWARLRELVAEAPRDP